MSERGTFRGEVALAWRRFWGLRWRVKGPILGALALLLVGGVASAAGGGGDDAKKSTPADALVADASPAGSPVATTARPTSTPKPPTETPTPKPPTATPTPKPPTPTPEPAGYSFGGGDQVVGTTVTAGATYRTRSAASGCYWARLSGFGGTIAEILANENTNGPAVVTVGANDKGFTSARCARWTQDLSPITTSPDDPFGQGTYIVGVDVSPGTWRSDGASGCYWARLSTFEGGVRGIVANANAGGPAITSARCGTWTKQ